MIGIFSDWGRLQPTHRHTNPQKTLTRDQRGTSRRLAALCCDLWVGSIA